MGFGIHREATAVPVYSDETGFGWAGISGGPGTIALAAGGIASVQLSNSSGFSAEPLDIPIIVKPSDSDTSYMLIGVRVPDGAVLGIRDRWVSYWEED